MTQRCKIWLGLSLVVYGILLLVNGIRGFINTATASSFWATLSIYAALIVGIALMLFAQRRSGFFLMCLVNATSYIVNVFFMGMHPCMGMLYFLPLPFVTWYFLKTDASWKAMR